jgi:hypothetical protein
MADNRWRLSGGIGVEEPIDPNQQYMTQGIGFDLRPVDGVPPANADDIPEGLVAEGLFMQWMGVWTSGQYYPKGAYVRVSTFTSVANKLTLEDPEPHPTGPPEYIMPTPWTTGTTPSNVSVVECIHNITVNEPGWFDAIRMYTPATGPDIQYEVVVAITKPGQAREATRIANLVGAAGAWTQVALFHTAVTAGTLVELFLTSLNSAAATQIDGDWNYQGPSQTGAPLPESWTVDNQQTNFRINKNDLTGADRSAALEAVIPGSIITVADLVTPALSAVYNVTGVFDNGTYMSYPVVLVLQAGGGPKAGSATSVNIEVPVPLATEYEEETGFFPAGNPTWGTVTTSLSYDDVDQGAPATTGYGIDIQFEPAAVSADWDIVTAS